eukprot:648410-Pelagomonas_calceolata.AAC.2
MKEDHIGCQRTSSGYEFKGGRVCRLPAASDKKHCMGPLSTLMFYGLKLASDCTMRAAYYRPQLYTFPQNNVCI